MEHSGLSQIVLIVDFAQYLLGSLDRRGWEFSYQLLNCPNTTVILLLPRGRWQVVEKAVFLDKHPLLWQQKGFLMTGHTHTDIPAKMDSKRFRTVSKEISGRSCWEKQAPWRPTEEDRKGNYFSLEMPLSEAQSSLPEILTSEATMIPCMM